MALHPGQRSGVARMSYLDAPQTPSVGSRSKSRRTIDAVDAAPLMSTSTHVGHITGTGADRRLAREPRRVAVVSVREVAGAIGGHKWAVAISVRGVVEPRGRGVNLLDETRPSSAAPRPQPGG
jgi:hypothetical protein